MGESGNHGSFGRRMSGVLDRARTVGNDRKIALGSKFYARKLLFPNRVPSTDNVGRDLNIVLAAALRSRSGCLVDVGANVGQTLFKLLRIDHARDYIGFEPQIDCCFFVDQFIRLNQLSGKAVLALGLSNRSEIVRLLQNENARTTASMIEGFRPAGFYNTSQLIPVVRGDDALRGAGVGEIAAVKIDVEGAELEVVDGLQETLQSQHPAILFEVLNHYILVTKEVLDARTIAFREVRLQDLEASLRALGYHVFRVEADDKIAEVDLIRPLREPGPSNYIAIHAGVRQRFLEEYRRAADEGYAEPAPQQR